MERELRQLREYLDREQIRETFNRYAFGVDFDNPVWPTLIFKFGPPLRLQC